MDNTTLTGLQQAVLGKIIQTQGWAEAHEMNRTMAKASKDVVKFHKLHRDMALKDRDEQLLAADPEVRSEFDRYLALRTDSRRAQQERLAAIDKEVSEIEAQQKVHIDARAVSWRNYRSYFAHAFDARWVQQKRKLQLEKFYLESLIAADPILLIQTN